jgi:YVTN family beta-propeller protein
VGSHPHAVAITPNGADAYVTNSGSGTVSVINTTTSAVVKTVPVGSGDVEGVAVTPNGADAYVDFSDTNSVSVISTANNAVVKTVPVGSFPVAVAMEPLAEPPWG